MVQAEQENSRHRQPLSGEIEGRQGPVPLTRIPAYARKGPIGNSYPPPNWAWQSICHGDCKCDSRDPVAFSFIRPPCRVRTVSATSVLKPADLRIFSLPRDKVCGRSCL